MVVVGGQQQFDHDHKRIGFVGPEGVGKTTVATLAADRLTERTAVEITGEAAGFFDQPQVSTMDSGTLGISWAILDYDAGVDVLATAADALDTAFVVATPETLDQVAPYGTVADRHALDTFLVVNRFEEDDRDRLGAFDGLELAEYLYENEIIETAMSAGEIPTLNGWTIETILLEALQSERLPVREAKAALDSGRRSVVNVEVESVASGIGIVRSFRRNGYAADFFRCNCRCHEGHVIARTGTFDT
ncbi:hypothetical protein SAMN05216388_1013108 [Halorientalis persicus]|uniref:Uncharacterized protein n=1 Tax=Halorientalis persicus TaxID=1367881 RepID=A0A1H8Q9F2_9EURY|nr:hypothetical protein [Halorientalis persicus]SEO50872.1 hypothetical protein SAMN05216388_1013108 [Halorientalis persicus]